MEIFFKMNIDLERVSKLVVVAVVFVGIFTACSTTALPPGKSIINTSNVSEPPASAQPNVVLTAHPSGFQWAGQTLEASGKGTAAEGVPAVQADLAAKNSARVDALRNLKAQVSGLPVGTDQTVGSIMDSYITIRHAVEQEISRAQDVGSQPLAQGGVDMQVQLPLQNVANILQQYQITTDQELPENGEAPAGVPNLI